jgi:hypothetical protein
MGGHPYYYYVPYQNDLGAALDELREREFAAGRYNPVMPFIVFEEPAFSKQRAEPEHESIDEAMEAADADGTRSILDISDISDTDDYGVAWRVGPEEAERRFGSEQPTRAQVKDGFGELLEDIERGKCRYVVVYEDGEPREILFAGYSYD